MKGLLYILLSAPLLSYTQENVDYETFLLQRIEALQIKKDSFYYKGMFPTFRTNGGNTNVVKEDNTIFFTALIAFTLQQCKNDFTSTQRVICDSIIERTKRAYSYFQNLNGKPTYNFWPNNPPTIFPNNWFLNLFNRSQALPDDVDDTVIINLIQNTSDSILNILHQLMVKHANATDRITKSIYKDYRYIPTYSTWFGNKMPIEIDFSVLSNALYFIYDKKIRLVKQDSATITLLSLIIKNNKHITDAAYISPQYARTPILLYHIARLMDRFNIAILDSLKPRLIKDCFDALGSSNNIMDSILLETSLMRLNALFKPTKIPDSFSEIEKSRFIFFIGTFTSMFSNPFKRIFMSSPMLKYYYSCPAYNLALLLENMVERRRTKIY